MAKKKISKVVSKVENKPQLKLSLDLKGVKFSVKADTFKEAMEKLYDVSYGHVKIWGVLTLEMGGKKAEMQLRPLQIKRAMIGKFAQELLYKRFLIILN